MRKLLLMIVVALFAGASLAPVYAADKPKAPADAETQFKRLDKDGNGSLSEAEFLGKRTGEDAEKAKKAFARIDKNSDGSVSLEEFKARPMKKKP